MVLVTGQVYLAIHANHAGRPDQNSTVIEDGSSLLGAPLHQSKDYMQVVLRGETGHAIGQGAGHLFGALVKRSQLFGGEVSGTDA